MKKMAGAVGVMKEKKTPKRRAFIGLLVLLMVASTLMTGCGSTPADPPAPEETPHVITEPLLIGTLSGPTGIGMVELMEDPSQYQISVFQSLDEVAAKVISGELEIAALPSNLAATLYNKLEGDIVLLATNTLGTLYIVENGETITSVEDLKGKTIQASGKGGTPEYILNQILTAAGMDPAVDVTINWLLNHSDVATTVAAQEGTIGMLPQPFATVVTAKKETVRVPLDLDEEWEKATDAALPMGVLVAQKSFVENRAADLTVFLADYEASVEAVNADPAAASLLVAKHGIIADAKVAEKAIPFCNIVYVPAQEGKADLEAFYTIISAMNPKSIGGKMPDEAFYYSPEQ